MTLNEILEGVEIRPKAIIIIGAPSSGKTFWYKEYLKKSRLYEYEDLNISNYSDTEERSAKLNYCLENKQSFIFEGIALKEDRFVGIINRINNNNYRTCLVYINKEVDIIKENNPDIAQKILKKLCKKNSVLFASYKDKFDKVIEVK
jgi:hypothetical protein